MRATLAAAITATIWLAAGTACGDETTFEPLLTGHPRLESTADELPARRTDERAVARVRAQADAVLAATRTQSYRDYQVALPAAGAPPAHEDDWPYWTALCAELRTGIEITARAWALTGQRKYLSWCRELMIAISQWPQWTDPDYGDGQPGLDTRELLRGMCAGYDYLHPDLPERDREQIARVIAEKGAVPIAEYGGREGSYLHSPNLWPNGYATINAELGTAALTLLGEDDRASGWLAQALGRSREFVSEQVGVDGGLIEGFDLGGVGLESIVELYDAAERVVGAPTLGETGLSQAIYFPVYFIAPGGGSLANFADAGGPRGAAPSLPRLAQRLLRTSHSPEAAWYLERTGSRDAEVTRLAAAPEHLPLARHFRSINWAAMRSGWGVHDALLAFRSGSSEHHNHRDQNSFMLAWGAEWLLNDPGYRVFSRPYPAERELTEEMIRDRNAYTEGSFGHNAILVDGRPQIARDGRITGFASTPALDCLTGDASGCYGPTVTGWLRRIASVPPDYYVVFDQVRTDGVERGLDLLLHTTPEGLFTVGGAGIKLDEQRPADEVRIRGHAAEAVVRFIGPEQPTFTHRQWPSCEQYGHFLKASFAPASEHRVCWALAAGPVGQVRLETRTVEADEGVMALQVRAGAATDTLALNDAGGPAQAGPTSFAGRWALVRSSGSELPRWALVEGTSLQYGSNTLVSSDMPVTVGAVLDRERLRASVECQQAATVVLHCPVQVATVEVTGLHDPARLSLDPVARTLTLHLAAGSYLVVARAG